MTLLNVPKSTVTGVRNNHSDSREDPPRGVNKWLLLALACLSVWLVCMGVNWLASQAGVATVASPSPEAQTSPKAPTPATISEQTPASIPEPVAEQSIPDHVIPRSEVIRQMGENLRRHAREDPDAPDVLSEERIKAVLERGGPID